jgi:oligopeptide transport system ATP-binding protein
VSVQAQVVNLLLDLQQQLKLTYLFIAHDLRLVEHVCSRVAVMYLGKIVEIADRDPLYQNPHHPYTQALFAAVPVPDPQIAKLHPHVPLGGEVPSPINPPSGCRFHPRCPLAQAICEREEPLLRRVGDGHEVACHFAEEAAKQFDMVLT